MIFKIPKLSDYKGVATIYAKTHLRTHLNRPMAYFYPSSEGFLMMPIALCVWNSNSNLSDSHCGTELSALRHP